MRFQPIDRTKEIIEFERKDVWLKAWIAVAASSNVLDKTIPSIWADQALKDYEERFLIKKNIGKDNQL